MSVMLALSVLVAAGAVFVSMILSASELRLCTLVARSSTNELNLLNTAISVHRPVWHLHRHHRGNLAGLRITNYLLWRIDRRRQRLHVAAHLGYDRHHQRRGVGALVHRLAICTDCRRRV